MTSIDRQRFVRDLSTTPLSIRSLPAPVAEALTRAGVTADDLATIAGSDHVIHGRAEAEQLYDRLVALEARTPRTEARIDHALALLDAARAASPTTPTPTVSPIGPSGPTAPRARTTGLLGPRAPVPLVPERPIEVAPSSYVRAIGDAAARSLDERASKHVTGPAADAQRRIRGMTDHEVDTIRALETRASALPPGPARRALELEIDDRVRMFEGQLASERAAVDAAAAPPSSLTSTIIKNLPPYLQESVRREGVVIPGVPGAIAPRFGGTPGFDWKVKF